LFHEAPDDSSSKPANKATVDRLLIGAEKGTRDMTWEQIEEGADQLKVEGGEATQIVARARAVISGAPADGSNRKARLTGQ